VRSLLALILLLTTVCRPGPALAAADCEGDFASWLERFKAEAASNDISQNTLAAALEGISTDPSVLSYDRRQGVFRQSFEQFSGRMVP
jgi:membrane-bound lytic murein transglycosylase B